MHLKDRIVRELEEMPEWLLQFLKLKHCCRSLEGESICMSSLQKDWLSSEEDEAWKDL